MSHGVDSVLQAVVGRAGDALVRRSLVTDAISNMIFVKYYALASATLLYFDFVVTFPDEVRRVWSTRFSMATLLFILNRYVPLVGYIFILLSLFNPPWSISVGQLLLRCKKFAPFPGSLNTFSQGIISLVLVLRTYALYERKSWVLLLTSLAGAVNIGFSAWATSAMIGNLFDFPPIVACVPILQVDFKDRLRYGWIATFSFDFLIFGLTIGRTFTLIRGRGKTSLVTLVMRDGSLFFLVMSTVNAINFAFYATVTNPFFASTTGTNSLVAHVVSVSLMNRLMLNLREESYHHRTRSTRSLGTDTAGVLTDTHLVFTTRILGNLTADLVTSADERRELDAYYHSSRSRRNPNNNNAPSSVTSLYTGRSILVDTESATSRTGPTECSSRSRAESTSRPASRTGSCRIENTNAVASGSGLGLTTSFASTPASFSAWDEESPSTAVDDTHPLRNYAASSPLSPLSPETFVEVDRKTASDEGGEDDWEGADAGAASGLSIEMTRLGRRSNSVTNDQYLRQQREDLHHDHYRTQTHGHTQEPD